LFEFFQQKLDYTIYIYFFLKNLIFPKKRALNRGKILLTQQFFVTCRTQKLEWF